SDHVSAVGVDGVDDFAPAGNLLVGEEAGSSEPPAAGGGDVGGLANDETAVGGALAVVPRHEVVGNVARKCGAWAGEWSHDDAMAELDGSEVDWGEEFLSPVGVHVKTSANSYYVNLDADKEPIGSKPCEKL